MDQEKRGLCPYDDKRYVLADMPNGQPNPNARVIRCLQNYNTNGEVEPDGGVDELSNDQLLVAKRKADARPGGAIRIGEVIEKIIVRDNLDRSVLPPARMSAPHTTLRALQSGLNALLPPFHPRVDSSYK